MDGLTWSLLALMVIVGLAICVIGLTRRRWLARREASMQDLAARHGWQWTESAHSYADRWSGEPFGHADRQEVTNLLTGRYDEQDVTYLDYEVGGGTEPVNDVGQYSIWAVQLPVALPTLEVRPAPTRLGRTLRAIGLRPFPTGNDVFSRGVAVDGTDERFTAAVLHPGMARLLTQQPGLRCRIEGDTLLSWQPGLADATDITARFDLLNQIIDLIPATVWKDYGARPEAI